MIPPRPTPIPAALSAPNRSEDALHRGRTPNRAGKILRAMGLAMAMLLNSPGLAAAEVQYVYDSAGRLVQLTYSNGVTIQYRYDAAGNRQEIVTTSNVNQPPSAKNDSASVIITNPVTIQVLANDSDPNGDTLTVTSVSAMSGGGVATIQGGGTTVMYEAVGGVGVKTFTYTISDGRGGTSSATVTVTVTGFPNFAPEAIDDTATVSANGSVVIPVLNNDSDSNNDTLTVISVSGVSGGGSASVSGGGTTVTYTAPSTAGPKTFTYTISDGHGGTASATVTVDVTGSVADYTPDPISLGNIGFYTNADYGNANTAFTVSGINQAITLNISASGVTENFADGYVYVRVNSTIVGSIHWAETGAGSVNVSVSNGDLVTLYVDARTLSGIQSGSATISVSNVTAGGALLSSFGFTGTVDADNNFNVVDVTPNPLDWSDIYFFDYDNYGYGVTEALTISGISQPITLNVAVSNIAETFYDGYLYIIINGTNGPSVHYAYTGAGSFNVNVSNGDQVVFYMDGNTLGGIKSGTANVTVRNASSGNVIVDTFSLDGTVDADNCDPTGDVQCDDPL